MGTHPIFESDFDCLTENEPTFKPKCCPNSNTCSIPRSYNRIYRILAKNVPLLCPVFSNFGSCQHLCSMARSAYATRMEWSPMAEQEHSQAAMERWQEMRLLQPRCQLHCW